MRYVVAPRPRRSSQSLRQYVTSDANAFRRSAGIPIPRPVVRKRFLGGLGCGSCAGACKKNLGDWSDVLDSITQVAKTTVPVLVNDLLGPSNDAGGLTTQQQQILTAQANAAAVANAQATIAAATPAPAGYVKIAGYNVPMWALGIGGLGAVFLLTR